MPVAADPRMRALARANEVRSRRKLLKAEMRSGEVSLAEVLLSEEDWLQSMQVRNILLATPGVGERKAARALQAYGLSFTVPLNRTSPKSREGLLAWLAAKHPSLDLGSWKPAR